jgi:archaellum component FlaC
LYLEKKEQELLSKVHELAGEVGKLDKTNAMLVKSNEDLAAKLNYFRACNDNQANLITQLRKDCNAY